MGTRKTYALFTISQENKIDEIYDCGKYNEREKKDYQYLEITVVSRELRVHSLTLYGIIKDGINTIKDIMSEVLLQTLSSVNV